ncbi:serine hydrolase [Bacillus sp. V59.32b]|uniref:serine hydrolase domain-containing protein n=1 Tax=Bacillus sp. V59.32b TaxID=1758642 RepID=UPI000E3D1FB8|nr:serine hydrolase domain-containing protein [Bacillus sp. V59.32b]RFU69664.1 class A beta-lactamase-related serine hydrolase [Bacillus sp. V59.32b]
MKVPELQVDHIIKETANRIGFSGVIAVKAKNEIIFHSAYGYANRAEEILNTTDTRFGIASGCKLFTAIAICQLVEKETISFETKIKDCLDIDFPHFDEDITVHHLLTHTSGIADYFDEDEMDDFEELWKERPMYLLQKPLDFLPMIQYNKMKFSPGEKFHYNNAGFILLGLIIEQVTGERFTDYVERKIFRLCNMQVSGYFSMDNLPKNTAYGYIENEHEGTWRTNVYSIPIKGGADGGAYITASDMLKLWEGLLSNKLLNFEYTQILLKPHICVKDEQFYGYGIWVKKRNNDIFKYHVMGYDPGVSFNSSFYPGSETVLVVTSNKGEGPFEMMSAIENSLITD